MNILLGDKDGGEANGCGIVFQKTQFLVNLYISR